MKERLKISIAWILLSLFIYNTGGYLIVFNLSEILNRSSMHHLLSETDEDAIQLLKITDISTVTYTGADEIIYQGKHYDIKKEISKNGTTYFYCINDKEEDNLYASLNSSVINNSDSQKEQPNNFHSVLLYYFIKDYFCNQQSDRFTQNNFIFHRQYFSDNFRNTIYHSIISPPPEFFIS